MNWKISNEFFDISQLADVFYGYEAFDINESKEWLVVIKKGSEKFLLAYKDSKFELPRNCKFPISRFLSNDKALVVSSRIQNQDEINVWIISLADGKIIKEFSVGDGVNDVAVLEDYIAISYFDEGVFSSISPSNQGLAFYNHNGEYQYGYLENVADPVDIADCYAICKVGANKLAFCAYTGFEVVLLKVDSKSQEIFESPEKLHGAGAITLKGNVAFLKGPYEDKKTERQSIFAYNLETKTDRNLGVIQGQYCRGLPDGKFLSYQDGNIVISSIHE